MDIFEFTFNRYCELINLIAPMSSADTSAELIMVVVTAFILFFLKDERKIEVLYVLSLCEILFFLGTPDFIYSLLEDEWLLILLCFVFFIIMAIFQMRTYFDFIDYVSGGEKRYAYVLFPSTVISGVLIYIIDPKYFWISILILAVYLVIQSVLIVKASVNDGLSKWETVTTLIYFYFVTYASYVVSTIFLIFLIMACILMFYLYILSFSGCSDPNAEEKLRKIRNIANK